MGAHHSLGGISLNIGRLLQGTEPALLTAARGVCAGADLPLTKPRFHSGPGGAAPPCPRAFPPAPAVPVSGQQEERKGTGQGGGWGGTCGQGGSRPDTWAPLRSSCYPRDPSCRALSWVTPSEERRGHARGGGRKAGRILRCGTRGDL